ncbi:Na+/H+ antiporter NhaA [uncultured Oscillibacter sp.]|uniref:Na+/H+ antiporter NhaA n=1 Tax=uncultured Oscillibacter sp. TaxID=876091 RepID=UPI002623A600|nr:Na+/H+ antiporter NhaA [uncultured Oscillibacter sp.]
MRTEEQTSRHLLLAVIITVFSGLLGLVTMFMAWEFWMVLLMTGGCFSVWLLHIARLGSNALYENLCARLMLTEFFFFGVHESSLFDVPAVACILILALFMLNKKWILYMLAFLYALTLLYHGLVLHTISREMENLDVFRLGLGVFVTLGGVVLAIYWINRRNAQRKWYERVFSELESAEKQNAVFLSNVSHELRTPINMVIGISEVALGKKLSPDIRSDITSIKMAGKRLSSQINNMLDYTEVRQSKKAAVLTPTQIQVLNNIHSLADRTISPLQSIADKLHPMVNYLILPLFAFVNAGVTFGDIQPASLVNVPLAVFLGLFVGKTLGIFSFTYFFARTSLASMPAGMTRWNLFGVSMLGGIGFTVALFIANLSFNTTDAVGMDLLNQAKLGVFTGSFVSGLCGYLLLKKVLPKAANE